MEWFSLLFGSGTVECMQAMPLTALAIAAIVGSALSAAGAITEGGIAAKKAKDARREEQKNRYEIEEERRRKDSIFKQRMYQDMTDRTEVQNMLRKMREDRAHQREANETRGAVLGTTSEQKIAEQDSLNKAYADGMAEMTRNASALKDGYLDNYEKGLSDYYQQKRDSNSRMAAIYQNESNQLGTAASNAMNAATNMGMLAAGMSTNGGAAKAPSAGANGVFNVPDLTQGVGFNNNPYSAQNILGKSYSLTPPVTYGGWWK